MSKLTYSAIEKARAEGKTLDTIAEENKISRADVEKVIGQHYKSVRNSDRRIQNEARKDPDRKARQRAAYKEHRSGVEAEEEAPKGKGKGGKKK